MGKILDVKNLRISFRTNNGRVKAVRDISFDLNKGETIAIVGESGSGKSVTARAMMGILAGNAIVEGGEIHYDGMDLMKISEEEFHELRGNRISMIFQDPLSSLNPIVKIGKQLTEAMILNGASAQKDAKNIFDKTTKLLEDTMVKAFANDAAKTAEAKKNVEILKKFIEVSNKHEQEYNDAFDKLQSVIVDAERLRIEIIGKKTTTVSKNAKALVEDAKKVCNPFLVNAADTKYTDLVAKIDAEGKAYGKEGANSAVLIGLLEELKATLEAVRVARKAVAPNFFTLGYYVAFAANAKSLDELAKDVAGMNEMTRAYIDENYMTVFLTDIEAAMKLAYVESTEKKKTALDGAVAMLEYLQGASIDVKELKTKSDSLIKLVEESINRLSLVKDSTAYTFKSAMGHAVAEYTEAMRLKNKSRLNKAEKVVFDNTDFDLVLTNMIVCVTRLIEDYKPQLEVGDSVFTEDAEAMIDYLKAQGAKMVFKVTKAMAKNRAIQLMEEVGIPEAEKRYNQYPFEFSGGMRQRIVIAIALSANPDILICDEPTTALDVTIQSQILELINKLKEERQLSVIFITHDLGVVANMADKIAVMYAGKIVEYGTVDDIFYEPKHPYTWALLSSMPDIYTEERLEAIPGTPPDMTMPPVGDAFAARNKYALKIDYEQQPPMFQVSDTHYAATWLLHPDAPKVEPPRIVTERIERMKKLEAQSNE